MIFCQKFWIYECVTFAISNAKIIYKWFDFDENFYKNDEIFIDREFNFNAIANVNICFVKFESKFYRKFFFFNHRSNLIFRCFDFSFDYIVLNWIINDHILKNYFDWIALFVQRWFQFFAIIVTHNSQNRFVLQFRFQFSFAQYCDCVCSFMKKNESCLTKIIVHDF